MTRRIVVHLSGGPLEGRTFDSHSADGLSLAVACNCYSVTSHCETGKQFGIALDERSCTVVAATAAKLFSGRIAVYEIKTCVSGKSFLDASAEYVADSKG